MATVSVSLPSDGTTADVSDYNTPITTIVNEFNGNIDNANIKTGAAIATTKLADDAGIGQAKVGVGFTIQTVGNNTATVATCSTGIPADNSIPQNTEGTEVLTQAITPTSTTNKLIIEAVIFAAPASAQPITAALFQDSTANALMAVEEFQSQAAGVTMLYLKYIMTAGTTSSTTFKIRLGANGDTVYVNGIGAATQRYSTASKSGIFVTEVKA